MASELKHDFPIIINNVQWHKNIKAFVKLTINIFPYYDVGNERKNIEAMR